MNFSNSLHFPSMNFNNLSNKKGFFQEYLKKLQTSFQDFPFIMVFVVLLIIGFIMILIWKKTKEAIENNIVSKKDTFVLGKYRTSFFIIFLFPFLIKLEVGAIFAFIIYVAKINLELYETIEINELFPENDLSTSSEVLTDISLEEEDEEN